MTTALGVLAVMILLFVISIAAKRTKERDDVKRKEELLRQALSRFGTLREADSCHQLYRQIVEQMSRLKQRNQNSEHLRRDANLLIELENYFIENEVMRAMDDVESKIVSLIKSRIPQSPIPHSNANPLTSRS